MSKTQSVVPPNLPAIKSYVHQSRGVLRSLLRPAGAKFAHPCDLSTWRAFPPGPSLRSSWKGSGMVVPDVSCLGASDDGSERWGKQACVLRRQAGRQADGQDGQAGKQAVQAVRGRARNRQQPDKSLLPPNSPSCIECREEAGLLTGGIACGPPVYCVHHPLESPSCKSKLNHDLRTRSPRRPSMQQQRRRQEQKQDAGIRTHKKFD